MDHLEEAKDLLRKSETRDSAAVASAHALIAIAERLDHIDMTLKASCVVEDQGLAMIADGKGGLGMPGFEREYQRAAGRVIAQVLHA